MAITNRELYTLVTGFHTDRSLEEFLRSLWALGERTGGEPIDGDRVADMLRRALNNDPPAFDPVWYDAYGSAPESTGTPFVDWRHAILFQITDLRRMDEDGQLTDPHRYYGITSPSGARWYNFDVLTYLECACRGSVGGYEADEVIAVDSSAEGEDSPVFELDDFDWEAFGDFLWCGQYYE